MVLILIQVIYKSFYLLVEARKINQILPLNPHSLAFVEQKRVYQYMRFIRAKLSGVVNYLYFRLRRLSIQLVMLVPIGLSLKLETSSAGLVGY